MVAKRLARIYAICFGVSLSVMLFSSSFSIEDWNIRLENSSEYTKEGSYKWTVYIVAEEPILDEIDHVVYILHPLFPNPKRTVDTRDNNFSLSDEAGGEFSIKAEVVFRNGNIIPVEHWLRLETPETSGEDPVRPLLPEEKRMLAVENTAVLTDKGRWEWQIYIAAGDEVLEQIACVLYILPPSYREPGREICERGFISEKGFPLTDKTWKPFDISVQIRFKDGQTRFLEHRLRIPRKDKEHQLIALQSKQNYKYVRAGVGGESYMAAVSDHIRGWETFRLIRLDGNEVALQSIQNDRYIRAGIGTGSTLGAISEDIKGWETFRLIQQEENIFALQSVQNGKYVRAGVGDSAYLAAVSPHIRGWELFRLIYIDEEKR